MFKHSLLKLKRSHPFKTYKRTTYSDILPKQNLKFMKSSNSTIVNNKTNRKSNSNDSNISNMFGIYLFGIGLSTFTFTNIEVYNGLSLDLKSLNIHSKINLNKDTYESLLNSTLDHASKGISNGLIFGINWPLFFVISPCMSLAYLNYLNDINTTNTKKKNY